MAIYMLKRPFFVLGQLYKPHEEGTEIPDHIKPPSDAVLLSEPIKVKKKKDEPFALSQVTSKMAVLPGDLK